MFHNTFSLIPHTIRDGRLTNALIENLPEPIGHNKTFGEGLGITFSSYHIADNTYYNSEEFDTTLIYYAKGSDTSGTPLYIDTAGVKIYSPISEECAFWNYSDNMGIYQIRTGNKVFLNSHTYVELIFRSFVNGILHADSSIGFFRNDTLGQKVYYSTILGGSESLLYDFTIGSSFVYNDPDYEGISLEPIFIGGIKHTKWCFYSMPPFPSSEYIGGITIGGIGSTTSLFVPFDCYVSVDFYDCGPSLTSFCVCGQTLYPDTATGQCALLTGIDNISFNNSNIRLYPNPTSDILHLSFTGVGQNNVKLIITDIVGQEVYSSSVSQSETTHDISKLSSGIYTWRIIENSTIIKTGKVAKE